MPKRRPDRPAAAATACLALALALACGAEKPPKPPFHRVNHHLLYESQLGPDALVRPHDTLVLDLPSARGASRPGACASEKDVHAVPYEITDAGTFALCISEEDALLTEVELFDGRGSQVAMWSKGQPCTAVAIEPGRYTLHVHLDASAADPLVFVKPDHVTVTPKAGARPALRSAATWDGDVPANQFLDLRAGSLDEILKSNAAQGLRQAWTLVTPWNGSGSLSTPELVGLQTWNYAGIDLLEDSVRADTWLSEGDLLYLERDPATKAVTITRGLEATPIAVRSACDTYDVDYSEPGFPSYTCVGTGTVLVADPSADPFPFQFVSSGGSRTFGLSDGLSAVGWEHGSFNTGWGWQWLYPDTNVELTPVALTVTGRFGVTSGPVPVIMPDEVALFNATFDGSGFPDGTAYWIVNASQPSFGALGFYNPTDLVRTVIAGRGVRAHVFADPSFQGEDFYVSPPVDSEMVVTSTDVAQLDQQSVGSLQLEPNTNDITAYDYEHHLLVGANTCIGCDLRGFDASTALNPFVGANFTRSDLSYARLTPEGGIEYSNFTDASLAHASLYDGWLYNCNFTRTDFSWADFRDLSFLVDESGHTFQSQCPKLEHVDLTVLEAWAPRWWGEVYEGLDHYFEWYNGSLDWWKSPHCTTSIAHSKVDTSLFRNRNLWQYVDAHGVDFSGQDLSGLAFPGVDLTGANFTNAKLAGTVLVQADLTGANLSGADLTGANLSGAKIAGLDLHSVGTLRNVVLSGLTLAAPNWAGLSLPGAKLSDGSYTNWDGQVFTFRPTSIDGAYMYNTSLNGADLSNAYLQNVSWWGPSATGANAIMVGTHLEKADLPGLNLSHAHLARANFTDAVLVNADLSSSTDYSFAGAVFAMANLKGATFGGANLAGASLYQAFVYAGTDSPTATVEILDDPAKNPGRYTYFQVNYRATIPPANTDGIASCPNGSTCSPSDPDCVRASSTGCLGITSGYWVSPIPPRDPDNCHLRQAQPGETPDDQGMVLVCSSHRRT